MQTNLSMTDKVVTLASWEEVEKMIQHWSLISDNGYYGCDYGYNTTLLSLLKKPQSGQIADQIISKMKTDLPILQKKKLSLAWDKSVPNRLIVHVDQNSTVLVIG